MTSDHTQNMGEEGLVFVQTASSSQCIDPREVQPARSVSGDQRRWDYDAMTAIAAHLRENPAHPFSGRQCAEFVLEARDRLYSGESMRRCGWCGEDVVGPCNHPGDPCGLYGAPDQSACEASDAAQVEGESLGEDP